MNLAEILTCQRDFMPGMATCKFDDYPMLNEGIFLSTTFFSIISLGEGFFGIQGRVILMGIIRSGRKSNLSEILYLSFLSASLMKF